MITSTLDTKYTPDDSIYNWFKSDNRCRIFSSGSLTCPDAVLLMDCHWQSSGYLVRNVQLVQTWEMRRTGGWSSPPTPSLSSTVWRWWDIKLSRAEHSLDPLLELSLTRSLSGLFIDHLTIWIIFKQLSDSILLFIKLFDNLVITQQKSLQLLSPKTKTTSLEEIWPCRMSLSGKLWESFFTN